jgi:hypothetical protein
VVQPCSGHKNETGGLPHNATFSFPLAVEICLLITKNCGFVGGQLTVVNFLYENSVHFTLTQMALLKILAI